MTQEIQTLSEKHILWQENEKTLSNMAYLEDRVNACDLFLDNEALAKEGLPKMRQVMSPRFDVKGGSVLSNERWSRCFKFTFSSTAWGTEETIVFRDQESFDATFEKLECVRKVREDESPLVLGIKEVSEQVKDMGVDLGFVETLTKAF